MYQRAGTSHYVAYQPRIASGLLEHKTHSYTDNSGEERTSTQVRVLPKGLAKLAKDMGVDNV